MPFRLFQDENKAQGVSGGRFEVGVNNVDRGVTIEQNVVVPWMVLPALSWLDYRCWVEVELDPGIALHKPLPQSSMAVDDLGVVDVTDPNMEALKGDGVNLKSSGGWRDVAQRMATSTYRFGLKGRGLRAGYQVPVPSLKTVGGVAVTPDFPQWTTGNILVGNLSGVPVWACRWEKWYFVTLPPQRAQTPPANLAMHIRGDVQPPAAMQVPYSQPDYNSVQAAPSQAVKPKTPGQ